MNEEMHNLLGRFFSGEATEQEKIADREWRMANKENESAFALLEKMWQSTDSPSTISFDTNAAWKKVDARITADSGKGKIVKMTTQRVAITIAASIVLLLGLWWMVNRNDSGMKSLLADRDNQEVRLADGSTVNLRKGALLQYPSNFKKGRRDVSLTGEAYFHVTPDSLKPFVIKAANAEVQVIGTSFTVSTGNDTVELNVMTGRVNFAQSQSMTNKILVVAGEKALYAGGNLTKKVNLDPNFNAWQTKKLVFQRTPLSQVAADLGDYFGINIVFKKEDAAQLSAADFTDTFNDQTLDSVLEEFEKITTYSVRKTGDSNYEISIK
jgi:transmembrane sensor